jgi:hypothetical protein
VRRTVQMVRQVECDGFVDIITEETEELTEGHQETFTSLYCGMIIERFTTTR